MSRMRASNRLAGIAGVLAIALAMLSCVGVPFGHGIPAKERGAGQVILFEFISRDKSGFLDLAGAVKIAATWDDASEFSDGLAAVRKDGLWGFIDENGSLVVPCRFLSAGNFYEGLAAATLDGKLWAYINRPGDFITRPQWDKAYDFSDGRGQVILGGLVGFVGKDGQLKIPLDYRSAGGFSQGLAEVQDEKGWLYVDTDGKEMFRPDVDETYAFSEGLAEFRKGDSWGYLEAKGRVAIAAAFTEAFGFKEGLGRVKQGDAYGYIDRSGSMAIPARFSLAGNFGEGLAPVRNAEGLWGYIDSNGKLAIPFLYDEANGFKHGLAYVERGQAFGYIDPSGVFVWKNSEARTKFSEDAAFPVRIEPAGKRGNSLRLEFLSAPDASLFLGAADEFTASLSAFDRQSRLLSARPVSDIKFREFAALQAWDFSGAEKNRISSLFDRFRGDFPWVFDWPAPVRLAKTSGKEELDSPYTRRDAIVLPQSVLSLDDDSLYGLLVHELCHVLLRYNESLRDGFYGAVGFRKINPARLQTFFQARKLTNPDALYYDYAYPETVDGREYLFLPLLVHLKDFDPQDKKEFFGYMVPAYTVVEDQAERAEGFWVNDAFVLVSQKSVKTYLERIGTNTEYLIHPEEVLAENFSLLLLGKKDVNKPELLESLRGILEEANQRRQTDDK